MYKVKAYYSDEDGCVVIEYKNNLLIKYGQDFERLFQRVGLPTDCVLEKMKDNVYLIKLPCENQENTRNVIDGMNTKLNNLINTFTSNSLEKEGRSLEIIPLAGYPIEKIKEDIKEAVKNRRNLCVIDHMKSYESFNGGASSSMVQAVFDYKTDDYSNIVIAAVSGDMEEIKQIAEGKMKKVDWT